MSNKESESDEPSTVRYFLIPYLIYYTNSISKLTNCLNC
jgi:hypothetical protein